jgi:hypothetical protein
MKGMSDFRDSFRASFVFIIASRFVRWNGEKRMVIAPKIALLWVSKGSNRII